MGSDVQKRLQSAAAMAAVAAGLSVIEGRRRLRERRHQARRYRLRIDQPLDDELRRVFDARFEAATSDLEHRDSDPDRRIHDARLAIKRLRSALRLVRRELGEAAFDDANARLRVAARQLAAARDATAAAAALDALVSQYPEGIDDAEFDRLQGRIAANARSATADLDEAAANALVALSESRAVLTGTGAPVTTEGLASGFCRSYRRGRAAGEAAKRAESTERTERLHEWRRRVKDLRHHAELLSDVDPARLRKIRRRAKRLSDILGDDHDLACLSALAADSPVTLRLVGDRRHELQRQALELGEHLYARKPRRVRRRLRKRARNRTSWQTRRPQQASAP